MQRVRSTASRLMGAVVPDAYRLRLRLRCLFFMYKLWPFRSVSREKRVICYYRDGSRDCPGLADRLKAMVSGYILAAENGRPYYIYHDHGFVLQDYLEPAEIDWRIELSDISTGFWACRRLWYTDSLLPLDASVPEYHSLCGGDIAEGLCGDLREKYDFHRVFHALFRPSAALQRAIDSYCQEYQLTEDSYIAVHIRFLDFFENVEQPHDTVYTRHASPEQQAEMIESINLTLEHLLQRHAGKKLLLFSDSPVFLAAPHPQGIIILPGEVGHIYAHAGNQGVILKAFVDMFIIARAAHVYSIVGPGTHPSGYSYMGARIGNKPFCRMERLRCE